MRPITGAALVAALTAAVLPGLAASAHAATTHRVLFDATKAETAGNADWIISTSQPDPLKQDSTPSSDKDWTGALSSWGVALQKTGQYTLDTLPAGNTITYGGSGALDLKNFDEFVLPEPNIQLSATEKKALLTFVQNGGGLFLISDHTGSDRNNDGWDSPKIINDILTNNGVDNTDPFGFSVDLKNISTDHPVAISDSSNPVLNGSFGAVKHSLIANGTTFTLKPADNPNVKGLLYLSTSSPGNANATFVTSTFGQGRVAIWNDSSPIDDGTGESGKTLYNGWTDSTANNAALALNATAWLAGSGSTTPPGGGNCASPGQKLANPGFESGATSWSGNATVGSAQAAHAGTSDAAFDGKGVATTNTESQTVSIPAGCSASLSFWLHVATAETTTSSKYDTFSVAVGSSTVATYSNLDAASGYQQHSVDLSAYAGQSVTIKFTGVEDYEKQTTFVLDDTALTAS
ncbi:hypothetical protein [Kutzneria sp. NPDC051319]|uniref:hypothetical protein n=1 Tax=Kutzneria sp. NPDC051319 TaxID=3155047 RepID=UPI00342432E5